MNRYSLWMNLLVVGVLLFGALVAAPNLFGDDPALQITREDGIPLDQMTVSAITARLDEEEIEFNAADVDDGAIIVRFPDVASQLRGSAALGTEFPFHVIALTLAPRTPAFFRALGLQPMSLGLDLRGGVHFLYQVDLDSALRQFLETYESDLRGALREAGIRNRTRLNGDVIEIPIIEDEQFDAAEEIVYALDPLLSISRANFDGERGFRVELSPVQITERQNFAIQQNTITLRNRVNELGVAEPVVQRQGLNRILVQLPGVQDPSQAERILGATATLEFRLVDTENDAFEAERRNRPPLNSILRFDRGGIPTLLRRDVIVSGDQLTDATFIYQQGQPAVNVRLNNQGAGRMLETTQANLNRPMAILFIEEKPELASSAMVRKS